MSGSQQFDNPNECVYCGRDLLKEGIIFGAGDGRGQEFQCAECFEFWTYNVEDK